MFSNELVVHILIYLNNHLTETIKIRDLEKEFNYNGFYLMRIFKKEMKLSIITYFNTIKIYNSINDIINKNDSMLKIALNNGFNSLEYFSETFKNVTGYSPLIFKKELKKEIQKKKIISRIIELKNIKTNSELYIKNVKPSIMVKVKKINMPTIFK